MQGRFPRAKRQISIGFRACVLLLLILLTVRLLWRAGNMETGFQTLLLQWRDATVGWILGCHEPIDSREPPEQADYWLREVDRVLARHPNDARLTMGAALVLDSPGHAYYARHVERVKTSSEFPGISGFDDDAINRAEDAFEKRCVRRRLDLAARATQLDPGNVEWWRLRALLLYRDGSPSSSNVPRDPDWLNILDRCARHDPDNALYDYLAADFHWKAAAEIDFSAEQDRLVIKDPDEFQRGVRRFEQGLAKRRFSLGDAGLRAAADFLGQTQIPLTDQERIVNNPHAQLRRVGLPISVWRWQFFRAGEKALAGDVDAALALYREDLALLAQLEREGVSMACDLMPHFSNATASQMRSLADAHKDAIGESQRQQIVALHEASAIQKGVVVAAHQELAREAKLPSGSFLLTAVTPDLANAMLVGTALSLVVLLLSFSLLTTILSRRLADGGPPVVGPVGQLATFIVAATATVVLFGLAPAEIMGRDVQRWCFSLGLPAIFLVAVVGGGWYWLRRHAYQFSIRAMLILAFILSLFFSLLAVMRPPEGFSAAFPFDLSIPAQRLEGMDYCALVSLTGRGSSKGPLAALQWMAYHGPSWTLLLWAGLLTVLHFLRAPKCRAALLGTLARAARMMSVLLLIAYLTLTPTILEQVETRFQSQMAFVRNPENYWAEVEKAVQRVRSDKQLMDALRASAKAEAQADADREKGP